MQKNKRENKGKSKACCILLGEERTPFLCDLSLPFSLLTNKVYLFTQLFFCTVLGPPKKGVESRGNNIRYNLTSSHKTKGPPLGGGNALAMKMTGESVVVVCLFVCFFVAQSVV